MCYDQPIKPIQPGLGQGFRSSTTYPLRLALPPSFRYLFIMRKVWFEWAKNKDKENQAKHGVAFEVAQYAFADPNRALKI